MQRAWAEPSHFLPRAEVWPWVTVPCLGSVTALSKPSCLPLSQPLNPELWCPQCISPMSPPGGSSPSQLCSLLFSPASLLVSQPLPGWRLIFFFFSPLCHPGNTPTSLAPASYSASLRRTVTRVKEFQAMQTVASFFKTMEIRDWKILLAHQVHYFTF